MQSSPSACCAAFTAELARAYEPFRAARARAGTLLPINAGAAPDHKLRRLDCWILNTYLISREDAGGGFDTVRCGFTEGSRVFPGSGIFQNSHIQIAVRNPAYILGVFRPRL
jgi:hypothetical protein